MKEKQQNQEIGHTKILSQAQPVILVKTLNFQVFDIEIPSMASQFI